MKQETLPALDTLGALYPHTLILELPVFSRPCLEASLQGGPNNEPARIYAHELHHWYDLVGTLWGQRYLNRVFTAFDSVMSAITEDRAYPHVLNLFDADREILFPRYYKYVVPGAPHGTKEQWQNRWSAGNRIKFDGTSDRDRPILFLRLETNEGTVARQPLSVGTLLELRAIAAEENTFLDFLESLSEDEKVVEQSIHDRKLLQQLYDPQLVTYSAAAHVLSSVSGELAIKPVLNWGASLADICLSLDRTNNMKLRVPYPLADFEHRILHGLKSDNNPGFAYACAMAAVKENGGAILDTAALNTALQATRLPQSADLYREAERTLQRLPIPALHTNRLKTVLSGLRAAGISIMRAKAVSHGMPPRQQWATLPSPVVMTSDCEQFHLGEPAMSIEDAEWLHQCQNHFDTVLRQALRASRGLDFHFTDYVY